MYIYRAWYLYEGEFATLTRWFRLVLNFTFMDNWPRQLFIVFFFIIQKSSEDLTISMDPAPLYFMCYERQNRFTCTLRHLSHLWSETEICDPLCCSSKMIFIFCCHFGNCLSNDVPVLPFMDNFINLTQPHQTRVMVHPLVMLVLHITVRLRHMLICLLCPLASMCFMLVDAKHALRCCQT